jgi:holo-[acyl-carrier protein] synthase
MSAPLAAGTDLVHVPRIAGNVERHGAAFVDRAFTADEQALCGSDARRLAGRWAAKESVLKVLGAGLLAVPLTDVEVLAEPSGAPVLRLAGRAAELAEQAGWVHWSVSISHDGDYASAVAVALRR